MSTCNKIMLTCNLHMQLIFVDMQHDDVKCNKYKLHININDACLDEQVAKLFTYSSDYQIIPTS